MSRSYALEMMVVGVLGLGLGCVGPHVPPGGSDCVAACENLRGLTCHGPLANADATPAGAPCEAWRCQTPDSAARTNCLAKAPSCAAAEACAP